MDSTDDDGELSVDGDAASSQVYSLNVSSIERQGFDIGTLTRSPTSNELEEIVKAGHIPHPNQFPRDVTGKRFPTSVLSVKKQNGETSRRCWIVYSPTKQAIYCFPCRIFWHTIDNPAHMQSSFSSRDRAEKSGKSYGIEYLIMRKAMHIKIAICSGVNFKDALKTIPV